jgi:hypothetical protein
MAQLSEAIKQALIRGETLQSAMESLYYAGYNKDEIEKAAEILAQEGKVNILPTKQLAPPKIEEKIKPLKPTILKEEQNSKISNYGSNIEVKPLSENKPIQKISYYGKQNISPKTDWMLIIMLLILIFLIAGLIGLILFKDLII